jgi:hypothetical protein
MGIRSDTHQAAHAGSFESNHPVASTKSVSREVMGRSTGQR